MGCCLDKPAGNDDAQGIEISQAPKNLKKVTWTSDKPITAAQLQAMRDEFWDTNPHYGGDAGVWATIKVALEQDSIAATKTYLEAAEIIVANSKLTSFYDTRGFLYSLPDYVVSDPTNLTR